MVMAIIIPNRCCGGIGASMSTPNPREVVRAAIKSAPPVWDIVSRIAVVTSPVLSAINRNRCVA